MIFTWYMPKYALLSSLLRRFEPMASQMIAYRKRVPAAASIDALISLTRGLSALFNRRNIPAIRHSGSTQYTELGKT